MNSVDQTQNKPAIDAIIPGNSSPIILSIDDQNVLGTIGLWAKLNGIFTIISGVFTILLGIPSLLFLGLGIVYFGFGATSILIGIKHLSVGKKAKEALESKDQDEFNRQVVDSLRDVKFIFKASAILYIVTFILTIIGAVLFFSFYLNTFGNGNSELFRNMSQ